MTDAGRFVVANTVVQHPPLVPEIKLHLADEALILWERTETELAVSGLPPPFWAFAWAGGQALARFVLDDPSTVAGRSVLDVGAGGGLAAIAAARAGASAVTANEVDRFALAAIALNAALNCVVVASSSGDLLDTTPAQDVVLVGDLFYEKRLAERAWSFLQRAVDAGAAVLIGDPRRTYLPAEALIEVASYSVPVPRALEDADVKRSAVFRLA